MTTMEVADIVIAVSAVGGLALSIFNYRKIEEVHILVNSRLSELLALTSASSHAAGKLEGQAEASQQQETDLSK